MIPNCAATRHAHFVLDGSGPAEFEPPQLSDWPKVTWTPDAELAAASNLDTLTKEEVASWKPGQRLLLSGKMLTGRDAAHKRIQDLLEQKKPLPVDFTNRVIYYVGPVDPVRDEAVGPAGPTTATRMDKFTDMMLGKTGLIAMIGKAERGPAAIESIRKHKAAYLMAVGGAAYLVSKAIRSRACVAFDDLGMEAIYEFEVKDMPVTVAVDANGTSVHNTGPAEWSKKIVELKIPVNVPAVTPTGPRSGSIFAGGARRRRLHDQGAAGAARRCAPTSASRWSSPAGSQTMLYTIGALAGVFFGVLRDRFGAKRARARRPRR